MKFDAHRSLDAERECEDLLRAVGSSLFEFPMILVNHQFYGPQDCQKSTNLAFYLLVRIYRGLKAAHCLAWAGHGYELMIILRTMTEAYFSLAWLIEEESEERAECFWLHSEIQQAKAGNAILSDTELQDLNGRWEKGKEEYKQKGLNPKANHWSGMSLQGVAIKLDKKRSKPGADYHEFEDLYHDVYRITSSHSHASGWAGLTQESPESPTDAFLGSDTRWGEAALIVCWSICANTLHALACWSVPAWMDFAQQQQEAVQQFDTEARKGGEG